MRLGSSAWLSPTWRPRRESTDSEMATLPVYRANQDPIEPTTTPTTTSPTPSYAPTHTLGWNESPTEPERAHIVDSGTGSPLDRTFSAATTAGPSEVEAQTAPMVTHKSHSNDIHYAPTRTKIVVGLSVATAFTFLFMDLFAVCVSIHNGVECFELGTRWSWLWFAQLAKGLVYLATLGFIPLWRYEQNLLMSVYTWVSPVVVLSLAWGVGLSHADEHSWVTALNAIVIVACAIHVIALGRVETRSWL